MRRRKSRWRLMWHLRQMPRRTFLWWCGGVLFFLSIAIISLSADFLSRWLATERRVATLQEEGRLSEVELLRVQRRAREVESALSQSIGRSAKSAEDVAQSAFANVMRKHGVEVRSLERVSDDHDTGTFTSFRLRGEGEYPSILKAVLELSSLEAGAVLRTVVIANDVSVGGGLSIDLTIQITSQLVPQQDCATSSRFKN